VFGEWVELPVVTPKHLRMSRRIKHIFTGDLESDVHCSPTFFGKEKHLLKAQLVRMYHTTTLIPKGLWKLPDEAEEALPELEEVEEPVKPTMRELIDINTWLHYVPAVLKEGRLTHFEPEFEEEEEKEKYMKMALIKDPYEVRLKPITIDRPVQGYPSAWNMRFYGDTTLYATETKSRKKEMHGCAFLESLVWPGYKMAIYNNRYFSVYVGYG